MRVELLRRFYGAHFRVQSGAAPLPNAMSPLALGGRSSHPSPERPSVTQADKDAALEAVANNLQGDPSMRLTGSALATVRPSQTPNVHY